MKLLVDFLRGVTKQAEVFVVNVHKLTDTFEREMKNDDFPSDTTNICITGLSDRIRTMNEIFASHVKIVQNQ
jgi:hypothetical protein